jgi:hypothetical protein
MSRKLLGQIDVSTYRGDNPTTTSYSASDVNINNATNSLARFQNKYSILAMYTRTRLPTTTLVL